MDKLIQNFQETNMKSSDSEKIGASSIVKKEHFIILDNLKEGIDKSVFEKFMKRHHIKFTSVEVLPTNLSIQFGKIPTQSCKIVFKDRHDLIALARHVVNKHSLRFGNQIAQLRIMKERANYNPDTSVIVKSLNPSCTEVEMIQELNFIFKHNLIYRKELQKWDQKMLEKQGIKTKEKDDVQQYFLLGCQVVQDTQTLKSKRIALVDFDSSDAAKVVIKAWNEKQMQAYSNRLLVVPYDDEYKKLSKDLKIRERSKSEKTRYSNLYVEKIPLEYDEQKLKDLFTLYGEVLSMRIKKPFSNVKLIHPNTQPYSAYVNFSTHQEALAAKEALNGQELIPGAGTIRIEFYRRDNQFLGVFKGLDKYQLLNNTHYRVLFLRGLDHDLTKSELVDICQKFGQTEFVTLKTTIEDGQIQSRGIAIVQYQTKEAAARALKNLPYEENLGDPSKVNIELYLSKESRILEVEKEKMKDYEENREMIDKEDRLREMIRSEPVQKMLKLVKRRLRSQVSGQTRSHSSNSLSDEPLAMPIFSMNQTLRNRCIPTPMQQFDTPSYLIKPIFPPARKQAAQRIAMTDRPQQKRRSPPVEIKPKPTPKEKIETIHVFKPKTSMMKEPERRKRRPRLMEETPIETEQPIQVQPQKPDQKRVQIIDSRKPQPQPVYTLTEQERQVRGVSWRNMDKKSRSPDTRNQGMRENPSTIIGVPRNISLQHRVSPRRFIPEEEKKQPKMSPRVGSTSPKHSYSPRYLEYLHTSPQNSPRANNQQQISFEPLPLGQQNILISPQPSPPQSPKAKQYSPRIFGIHEPEQKIKHFNQIPHNNSNPYLGSPITLNQVAGPKLIIPPLMIPNIQSPQPCISPSSLINVIIEREQEGFSAPVYHDLNFDSYNSGSSQQSSGQNKPPVGPFGAKKQPTGLFNWNWDSSDGGDGSSQQNDKN